MIQLIPRRYPARYRWDPLSSSTTYPRRLTLQVHWSGGPRKHHQTIRSQPLWHLTSIFPQYTGWNHLDLSHRPTRRRTPMGSIPTGKRKRQETMARVQIHAGDSRPPRSMEIDPSRADQIHDGTTDPGKPAALGTICYPRYPHMAHCSGMSQRRFGTCHLTFCRTRNRAGFGRCWIHGPVIGIRESRL